MLVSGRVFVGDSGFLQFLRVVSSDDKANPGNSDQHHG